MIPEEHYSETGELDTAALFLASLNSAYVTGVNLPVDGGYTAMQEGIRYLKYHPE